MSRLWQMKQRAINEARERRKDAAETEQGDSGTEQDGTAERSDSGGEQSRQSEYAERPVSTGIGLVDPRSMSEDERQRRGNMLKSAPAIEVAANQIVSTEGKSARKAAEEWWDINVGEPKWYDTEVGEVEINRNSVESSLAHRYGQMKLDAITSLVDGFGNAVYLGTMPDHTRQEGVNNHYFAFPIIYNGKRCYVFCRALHDNNTNRLYVHEVFVEENIKKGNTLQTAASQPHGGIALYRDILANVLDTSGEKNSSSEGGVSSISHAAEATPAISLQSRGDDMSDTSEDKGSENSETGKERSEKVAENQTPNAVQTALAAAEQETNTEPTEAQKEAGNYKKGHVKIDGYDVTIENPKGSVRRGTDASGKQWEQEMQNTYGYIRGTEGVDGDHIDVFLSDNMDDWNGTVYVIDQVKADGSFDEHKVMYGFNSAEEAAAAYNSNYSEGWQGLGTITGVSKEEFKKWIDSSHRKTKPFAEYSSVKVEGEQAGTMRQPTGQTVDGDIAHFHKETDSSGRTAIDEANYNADDLVAPLLVDGKKSHIGITQIVPYDINEPTYTRAYYDYAHLIDPKTNKGWQAVGDKIDEWNASHKKDEQGFDDGDAPQVRFPSVDAALKFAEWFEASTSHQEQRGAGGVLPSAEEVALRDGLVEVLRGAGIEVVTDDNEAQRVLSEANGRVMQMGTTTRRRQEQIGKYFDGRNLSEQQRLIVDVFSEKNAEATLSIHDIKGKLRRTIFRQGQDSKAGVKHSVFRHYDTNVNNYTADEILFIPDIVNQGMRKQSGNKVSYSRDKNGITYTVTTQLKSNGEELFTNYYTNRKPTAGTSGASNTATQHAPQQSVSGAKLQKVIEPTNEEGGKIDNDTLFKAAKKKFGVTHDLREAGYILPDGTMLDFSGRHELFGADDSGIKGRRATDHRVISSVAYDYDQEGNEIDTGIETNMPDFIRRGAIRIDYNNGSINLSTAPTSEQRNVLRRLIAGNDGDVYVDFGDGWDSDHYAEYSEAKPSQVLNDIEHYFRDGIKPSGNVRLFRTEAGEVYGFVKGGRIYLDPRLATAETAVHEYGHLWAAALREANPTAWRRLVEQMRGDEALWRLVEGLYPELTDADALAEEVFCHFAGRRGAERLRAEQARMERENKDGVLGLARVKVLFERLRGLLRRFWEMSRDLFAGKVDGVERLSAEDFADMALADLLSGISPSTMQGSQSGTEQAREQRGAEDNALSEGDAALGWALVDVLRGAGIEVVTDEAEGQRVLDAALRAEELLDEMKRKSAQETVSAQPQREAHRTDISSADGAKVLQNLDTLAKKYENISGRRRNFVAEVAEALEAVSHGSNSKYATFEARNGHVFTIRLSNHNASTSTFDNHAESNGISIVVSSRSNNGITNAGDAHIVEFFYPEIALRRKDGAYAAIVRSIQQALYSGEYKDTTGLAQREEVNDAVVREARIFGGNSGYVGYSKSRRAEQAEEEGLRSASQMNKDFVNEVNSLLAEAGHAPVTLKDIKDRLWAIRADEWHHTSKFGNRTNYYSAETIADYFIETSDDMIAMHQMMSVKKRLNKSLAKRLGVDERSLDPMLGGKDYAHYFVGQNVSIDVPYDISLEDFNQLVTAAREMSGVQLLRTANGEVYGFVRGEKIYLDPRIATAETPIHEYTHLWAEALRGGNAAEWANVVELMRGTGLWDEVKRDYPELKTDDEVAEEVLAHFSGRRGAERLRAAQEAAVRKAGGVVEASHVISSFEKVKQAIKRFWRAFADFMHIHYESAEEVADRVLADLLDGVNPGELLRKQRANPHKAAQLDIVTRANVMEDDYHTGIRGIDDIKTFAEAVEEGEGIDSYPDYSGADAERALRAGKATVYSSKPIENGVFVSMSRMEAEEYAGGDKVYSKEVPLEDVAWLYASEGQYAKVERTADGDKPGESGRVNEQSTGRVSGEEIKLQKEVGGYDVDVVTFHRVIDEMFDNADFDKSAHARERYDLGATPEWMKGIGISGERFTLSFKNIKTHLGKDADHNLTAKEWHELPSALKHPFLVTSYGNKDGKFRLYTTIKVGDKFAVVGVDVVRINQGKGVPMLELNRIKTVFGRDRYVVENGERILAWDKNITPEQEALLRGHNYREYPTIQELSAAKVDNDSDIAKENGENVAAEGGAEYREVTDEELIAWLESQPKMRKIYRSMVLIDGKLYPPMSSRDIETGKLRSPEQLGRWTESQERPDLAFYDEKTGKWYFKLVKSNGKSIGKVLYNPYIHTSTTMLNDQFKEAQSRPELVVVEMEIPISELDGVYRAERAADATGRKPWNAGVIQKHLTGTRDVILSRWAKPVRIVPNDEVARHIYDMIDGRIEVMPTNVVTPQVRAELEKLGVQFVNTTENHYFCVRNKPIVI